MTPRFMIIHFYPLFFIFIIKNTQFDWWSIWTNTIWTMEYQMHDVVSFTNNIDVHTVVVKLKHLIDYHQWTDDTCSVLCQPFDFYFLLLLLLLLTWEFGMAQSQTQHSSVLTNEKSLMSCVNFGTSSLIFLFSFCFHLFLIGIRLVIIILSAAARQRLAISLRRVNTLCVKREFICFLMKK